MNEGSIDAGGGVRLFYRGVGDGADTIVVLHGGPGFTMDYIAADLEPLAGRHTLIFYDQRGTGGSTLVSDSAGLDAQRFVEDVEAVRLHFALERLVLLGHSWGTGLAALTPSGIRNMGRDCCSPTMPPAKMLPRLSGNLSPV